MPQPTLALCKGQNHALQCSTTAAHTRLLHDCTARKAQRHAQQCSCVTMHADHRFCRTLRMVISLHDRSSETSPSRPQTSACVFAGRRGEQCSVTRASTWTERCALCAPCLWLGLGPNTLATHRMFENVLQKVKLALQNDKFNHTRSTKKLARRIFAFWLL